MEIVIDSRDRLSSGQHSFVSTNSSSDFVVTLPRTIEKIKINNCQIPLTYNIFNEFYNTVIIKVDPLMGAPHVYYKVVIPVGNYDATNIAPALQLAINTARPLVNPLDPTLGATKLFLANYDTTLKKLQIKGDPGAVNDFGFHFIATSNPAFLPLGDPDGFPSELVPPPITPDPERANLTNIAGLIGLFYNSITPNPTSGEVFPIGTEYAFGNRITYDTLPYVVNLSGDSYLYIRTNLAGQTNIEQSSQISIDTNTYPFSASATAQFLDRGILAKIDLNQAQYSLQNQVFATDEFLFLNEATNVINFRLTFRNNIPVNLNGVNMSLTIET